MLVSLLCASLLQAAPRQDAPQPPTNILVVVLDDISASELSTYGLLGAEAVTPNLDALAAQGVLFENAWSSPICSPSRALMLTGRYGFRTLIGANINKSSQVGLPLEEVLLPELLRNHSPHAYSDIAIGKWHLGSLNVGEELAPNVAGFSNYVGAPHNLVGVEDYFSYEVITNGEAVQQDDVYITTEEVDAVLEFAAETPEPWYCQLNLHAPHEPWHPPPLELHTSPIFTSLNLTRAMYVAMIEAADTELGRMWASLSEDVRARTTVIVVGDNGTQKPVVSEALDPTKSKGTLFEGGLHVPLLIAGRHVRNPGRREDALVHVIDVYATVAELAGVDHLLPPEERGSDSVSLVPYLEGVGHPSQRSFLFSERFGPNGGPIHSAKRAVRDERWKLIRRQNQPDVLYDLQADPYETFDLLQYALPPEAQVAYARLQNRLEQLVGE